MTVLDKVIIPCDGATLLVEDVLSGIDVYLQAPDGSKQGIVSVRVKDGQVISVEDYSEKASRAMANI